MAEGASARFVRQSMGVFGTQLAVTALGEDLPATLLILGTHARKGWQHLMLGSIAERVVRTASVPVLTVGPAVVLPEAEKAAPGSEVRA